VTAGDVEITVFRSLRDPKGERRITTGAGLLADLAEPQPATTKETARGWAPVVFRGDVRAAANVERVSVLVLDYDGGEISLDRAAEIWGAYRGLIHTTWSHSAERPKYRIVLLLSRPVSVVEHGRLWRWADGHARAHGMILDAAARDAARFWYAFCARPGFEARPLEGDS